MPGSRQEIRRNPLIIITNFGINPLVFITISFERTPLNGFNDYNAKV